MFGFYQEFIPLFQTRIAPWRKLQVGQPLPGQLTAETERSFFKGFWLPEHQQLLDELRNNFYQVYYLLDLITTDAFMSKLIGLKWLWELSYFKPKTMKTLF